MKDTRKLTKAGALAFRLGSSDIQTNAETLTGEFFFSYSLAGSTGKTQVKGSKFAAEVYLMKKRNYPVEGAFDAVEKA